MYSSGSQLYLVSDSTGGPLQLQVSSANPLLFYTNNTERMRIPSTGQLLLGTTSTPSGGSVTEVINNPLGGGIELVNNNNGGGNIAGLSAGGLSLSTFTGAVGSEVYTPRMVIDSNGLVGIGTSIPSFNVTVAGCTSAVVSAAIINRSTVSNTTKGGALRFRGTDTVGTQKDVGDLYYYPSDPNWVNSYLAIYTRSSDVIAERLRITGGGNLLVGTTTTPIGSTATVVLNNTNGGGIELVNNNNGGGNIAGLSAGGLSLSTFTGAVGSEVYTQRAVINSSGQVGIGTATVASGNALSVYGGNLYVNGLTFSQAFSESESSPAISGNTLTLNLASSGVFSVSLNSNISTLTLTNIQNSGSTSSFVLVFTYNGTAYTVAWPASFRWPNGTAPTLTNTNNKRDVFTFFTYDGGANWQAFISGQNS